MWTQEALQIMQACVLEIVLSRSGFNERRRPERWTKCVRGALVKVDGYSCRDMKPENIINFIKVSGSYLIWVASLFKSNLHTFGSIEFIVSGLEPLKAINKVKNQERHGQIRSQSVPRNEPQLAIELTPVNQKKIRTSREAQRREPRSVRQGFKNES